MKRFSITIVLLLINIFCFSVSGIDITTQKLNQANADISQIKIDFCNNPGKYTINYSMNPGGTQNICLKAINNSTKDIETTIGFVDGTTTNDQQKNKACMQQGEDKKFGQYVTGFISSFIIPAKTTLLRYAKITLPLSARGKIKGCIVYYTKSVSVEGEMGLSILMRKAKFIDIQVRENIIIKKYIVGMSGILLLISYTRIFLSRKKAKKLPQR